MLDADFVIAGIGAAPNVSLAAEAGLDVDGGISVDASLRTSDPDIFAAGDAASAFNPLLGRRITVHHWSNALNGGPAAARAMLGQPVSYDRVPYFFTDQYDLGMEYAGLPEPGTYDQVVYRGDPESGEFVAFWLNGGSGRGRDERQRLGRQRRHPGPHPGRRSGGRRAGSTDPDVPLGEV